MTTTNNALETTDVRALTDTEVANVSGGFFAYRIEALKRAILAYQGCEYLGSSTSGGSTVSSAQCDGER